MKLDLQEYERQLKEARLELANIKGTRLIKWDPRRHPRDLMGRFRNVVDSLEVGETLEIPPASLEDRDLVIFDSGMKGYGPDTARNKPKTFITRTADGAAIWRSDEVDYDSYEVDMVSMPVDEAADQILNEQGYDADMVEAIENDSPLMPEERAEVAKEYNDRVANATPSIRMPLTAFGEFLEDGTYRTQHETGTSQGMLNPMYRREVEFALWPDMDEPPVYGFMSESQPTSGEALSAPQYGPVKLTLKDEVKERSTTTLGDSLDLQRIPIANGEADEFSMALLFDDEDWREGPPLSQMLELQIFGGVTLDDVESISIDAAFLEWLESDRPLPWGPTLDEQRAWAEIQKKLAEKGIKLETVPYPDDMFEFEEWLYADRLDFAERWADDNGLSVGELETLFNEWDGAGRG